MEPLDISGALKSLRWHKACIHVGRGSIEDDLTWILRFQTYCPPLLELPVTWESGLLERRACPVPLEAGRVFPLSFKGFGKTGAERTRVVWIIVDQQARRTRSLARRMQESRVLPPLPVSARTGELLRRGVRMRRGRAMQRKGIQRIPGQILRHPQNRIVGASMFKEERRSRFHPS